MWNLYNMKLIKFDATNSKTHKSGEAIIRFNMAGGISLTKTATEELGLKAGQKVSVVQDEEKPEDWYLVINDEDGFELRENTTGTGVAFNNAYIVHTLKNFLDIEANISSYCFKIATKPSESTDEMIGKKMKIYAILTATLETKDK